MAEQTRRYDLVLVLSTETEDDRRAKIVSDVTEQITAAGGEVARNDDWSLRPLSYEIAHQQEGEYHLLQFSAPTPVLESLSHSLRIDDAVLRFRIIRELPGTPAAPESAPPIVAGTPPPAPAPAAAAATATAAPDED